MRKFGILIVGMIAVTLLFGCQKEKVVEVTEATTEAITVTTSVTTEAAPDETTLQPGQVYAPLTGLPVATELAQKRPVAVMLDNYVDARPQAGLIDAEIVYEMLAEGMITRYMAIFQTKAPDLIGPIRSSRLYYIERALEYDPLYVHVGGSPEALTVLKTLAIGNIDGLAAGKDTFWRLNHKKAPNNMYSSMEAIRTQATRQKHKESGTFETWDFHTKATELDGAAALKALLTYKKPSEKDKTGYYITYDYDASLQVYKRGYNGKEHCDESGEQPLTAMNILVQEAAHKVVDSAGRREIQVIGKGKGYYLTLGKMIPVTWEKSKATSLTRFYKASGDELTLNPGVTWVQVIESLESVKIE